MADDQDDVEVETEVVVKKKKKKHVEPSNFSLAGTDFKAPPVPKKQANILIIGDGGVGKSTFLARYAATPMVVVHLDKRGSFAFNDARKRGREIAVMDAILKQSVIGMAHEQAKAAALEIVKRIEGNVEKAVRASQKGDVRVIGMDTVTEYEELLNVAHNGRTDKVKGDYGKSKDFVNRAIWRLFNLAREGDAHLIVLGRAKEVWENNQPTGEFELRGPKSAWDAADWAGLVRLNRRGERSLKIIKAGIDGSQYQEVYEEDDWGKEGEYGRVGPFVYACMKNYPGTEKSDWS